MNIDVAMNLSRIHKLSLELWLTVYEGLGAQGYFLNLAIEHFKVHESPKARCFLTSTSYIFGLKERRFFGNIIETVFEWVNRIAEYTFWIFVRL